MTPAGITILLPERILVVHTLLLDLNGTVAIDGHLLPGVAERVQRLSAQLRVIVASGDTFGTAEAVARQLDVERRQLEPTDQGSQKAALVEELGAAGAVVIGNGANDAEALRAAGSGAQGREVPQDTHTAEQAAAVLGVPIGAIVKSLVFHSG